MGKGNEKQLSVMRWISFGVVTLLFISTAASSILNNHETDKLITAVFLIVLGFAWGANFWKVIVDRIIK
jgi:hypothetical protein